MITKPYLRACIACFCSYSKHCCTAADLWLPSLFLALQTLQIQHHTPKIPLATPSQVWRPTTHTHTQRKSRVPWYTHTSMLTYMCTLRHTHKPCCACKISIAFRNSSNTSHPMWTFTYTFINARTLVWTHTINVKSHPSSTPPPLPCSPLQIAEDCILSLWPCLMLFLHVLLCVQYSPLCKTN